MKWKKQSDKLLRWNKRKAGILILLGIVTVLTGCSMQNQGAPASLETSGLTDDEPGIYDSADTAVVVSFDTQTQNITLKNRKVDKEYTLVYDGATCFYDKYGQALSAQQIAAGDIVDLTFYKPTKRCNTMQLNAKAWENSDCTQYTIDYASGKVMVGSQEITITKDTVLLSAGKKISLEDLNPIDTLSFQGMDSDLYSVVVTKGHGYLRLQNDEYFYDGWVEVGDKVIQKVTENMLLTVPEGSQQVIISNKGTSGTKQIQVERNKEIDLDVGDLKGKDPESGTVIFTITPSDANLYIDGKKVDYHVPVKLEYGIHQMIVRADGYDTITQYLKVGQPSAGIEVDMKASTGESSTDTSGNDTSADAGVTSTGSTSGSSTASTGVTSAGNTSGSSTGSTGGSSAASVASTTSTQGYYVTIEGPSGAEVYLDGNYVGVAPCNFKKEAGSHSITLRKTGYTSKAYTVQVDSDAKNVSYSFPDLTAVSTN